MAVSPQKAVRTATRRRKAAERQWHEALRAAAEQGVPVAEIASNAGVSRQHMYKILKTLREGG